VQYYLIDSKIPLYVGNGITSHNPPLHIHHHTELIYIIDGSVMLNVSGHEYALEKGDAAVIFPMQPHCFVGGERNWLLVNFVPGFCPDYRDLLMRSYPTDNVVRRLSGSEVERLLLEAYSEYKRGGEYSERITRGYISAAFGRLLSEIELSETKHQYYDMIEQIVRYCDANYTSPITLTSLAAELHISRSYVSRMFSDGMKVSFSDYINGLRVHHACSLLNNSDKSVTEIALVSGFESVRTFNRAFAKVWDMTPTQYRLNGRSKA